METLHANDLRRIIDAHENALVVSIVSRDDYEAGHIPGAICVPLSDADFIEHIQRKTVSIAQPVILYDREQGPVAQAVHISSDAGFTNVRALQGGLQQWNQAGFSIQSGSHTFN